MPRFAAIAIAPAMTIAHANGACGKPKRPAAEKELFPAPDEVIGSAARAWFRVMLGLYMRCETEGAHDELDAGFDHTQRIEQELEAALETAER